MDIFIIGGSFAGLSLARHLQNDGFVYLVEPKEYFEYTPSMIEGLAGSNSFEQQYMIPMTDITKGFRLIRGKYLGLHPKEKQVAILNSETLIISWMKFDVLIIATGLFYPAPIRSTLLKFDDRVQEVRRFAEQFSSGPHQSIVVNGGGEQCIWTS